MFFQFSARGISLKINSLMILFMQFEFLWIIYSVSYGSHDHGILQHTTVLWLFAQIGTISCFCISFNFGRLENRASAVVYGTWLMWVPFTTSKTSCSSLLQEQVLHPQ